MRLRPALASTAGLVLLTGCTAAAAATGGVTLHRGESLTVVCDGTRLSVSRPDRRGARLECKPVPSASATPSPSATTSSPPSSTPGWQMVLNDRFDAGGVPSHWGLYDGPYGSSPGNCATPSHVAVAGGSLSMLMRYESSGRCGSGWYTAGMQTKSSEIAPAVNQRITLRWKVVGTDLDTVRSHRNIPMAWPDSDRWPSDGEDDYCEGSDLDGCTSFIHYGSGGQDYHDYRVDLEQWHVMRAERSGQTLRMYIDDMVNPVWTKSYGSQWPATPRNVVLQQECRSSCPSGSSGTETILIDWITVERPI